MKGRLKSIVIFLMIAGVKCDFMDELISSLVKLQDTVDKLSLEQINTIKKVDQLQDTVDKLNLEQIQTNKKVDQLEEKMEKLGTKVITVDDLSEVNNNISDAIDHLKKEMKTLSLVQHSRNGCKEDETSANEDHLDAPNHVVKEVEEKGKNTYLPAYELYIVLYCCSNSCCWWSRIKNYNKKIS